MRSVIVIIEGDLLALGGDKQDPATGKSQPILLLWNLKTDELVDLLQNETQEGQVNVVAASPDSGWLAAGLDQGQIILWDRLSNQKQTLKGHSGLVEHLVWSPDSQALAASSSDGTIKLWIGE